MYVICHSGHLYVTDGEKNVKFKLLYFPNNVGYQAGNVEAYISQNAFYPMNMKL